MDRENYRNTQALGSGGAGGNVRMLSDFLDGAWPKEVPDPYYGGEDGLSLFWICCRPLCRTW